MRLTQTDMGLKSMQSTLSRFSTLKSQLLYNVRLSLLSMSQFNTCLLRTSKQRAASLVIPHGLSQSMKLCVLKLASLMVLLRSICSQTAQVKFL
jgi:hypothetical protein